MLTEKRDDVVLFYMCLTEIAFGLTATVLMLALCTLAGRWEVIAFWLADEEELRSQYSNEHITHKVWPLVLLFFLKHKNVSYL